MMITPTFRAARVFRILPTHTFRVAGVLHFTYTHFSGGRGFAFYLHTLSGRFLSKFERSDFIFIKTFRTARTFFLKLSINNKLYIETLPRCARGLYHFIENEGDDLTKIEN